MTFESGNGLTDTNIIQGIALSMDWLESLLTTMREVVKRLGFAQGRFRGEEKGLKHCGSIGGYGVNQQEPISYPISSRNSNQL